MKFRYKPKKTNKHLLLYGAVFPLFMILIMLSSPWTGNYRILRMMGCYAPMPLLVLSLLLAEFFLSLSFFCGLCAGECQCKIAAYNSKLLTLAAAFFLAIWFCMEFCVISPLVSLLCALASLASSLLASAMLWRWYGSSFLSCVAASAVTLYLLAMNFKALFI